MKKNKLITFCAFAVFLFNSCASTKQNSEYSNESYDAEYDDVSEDTIGTLRKPEATDDFLADLNPIQIENVIMLVKSGKSVKPKEITKTYLIPTNNTVELHFRDTINAVCVILNKKERENIISACKQFLQEYDQKTLKHQKVNSKTAYFKSTCSLYYGLTNAITGNDNIEYFVNYEFIDKRPYLLLYFIPSRVTNETETFTPKIQLYMSPSQIRDFIQQMDQKNLETYLTETIKKAYTY